MQETEFNIYAVWIDVNELLPPETIMSELCSFSARVEIQVNRKWYQNKTELHNGNNTSNTVNGYWYNVPPGIEVTHWRFIKK